MREPGRALQRAAEVLRSDGARVLALKLLGRTFYRRVVLIERQLPHSRPEEAGDAPVAVGRLNPDGIPAYLRFRPSSCEDEIIARLAAGDYCFVTWAEDRITSAAWYQPGRAHIPELGCELRLSADQLYVYDSWTDPEFRGRNLATARGTVTMPLMRAAGFRSMVAFILPENGSAFGPPAKLGFRHTGSIGFIGIGSLRVFFLRDGKGRLRFTLSPERLRRAPG